VSGGGQISSNGAANTFHRAFGNSTPPRAALFYHKSDKKRTGHRMGN
jgi:hypothetical protein